MFASLIENIRAKRWIGYLILVLAIIGGLVRFVYMFEYEKENHHSDEGWTYGFANSLYDGFIYWDLNNDVFLENATYKNYDEWIDGQVFRDYLTVNDGEQFRYDSVFYNKLGDASPGLYDMLLHTVCSFFPNTFSWWYAFSINLVLFVGIAIVFFLLCRHIFGFWYSVIITGCMIFSRGFSNLVIYLRMYVLLTLIVLFFALLMYRLKEKNFENADWEYRGIAACVLLGGYTHYYFLPFIFFFTLGYCIYLACKRMWKKFFFFGGWMAGWVIAYLLLYPFFLYRMIGAPTNYEVSQTFPYSNAVQLCLTLLFSELFGFGWVLNQANMLLIGGILFLLLISFGAAVFLLRNEKFGQTVIGGIKQFLLGVREGQYKGAIKEKLLLVDSWMFAAFLTIIGCVLFVARFSNITSMSVFTDRYLFYLMPFTVIVVFAFLLKVVTLLLQKRVQKSVIGIVACVILIGAIFAANILHNCYYLFPKNGDTTDLAEYTADADVIMYSDAPWKLEYYCVEFRNADEVYYMLNSDRDKCMKDIEQHSVDNPVYLVLLRDCFADPEANYDEYSAQDFKIMKDGVEYTIITETEEDFLHNLPRTISWIKSITYEFSQSSPMGDMDIFSVQTQ